MTRTEHIAIKGTREGLVLYLDPDADFAVLQDELGKLLRESEHFLQGAAVRCYGGERIFSSEEQETLKAELESNGLGFDGWLSAFDVYTRKTTSREEDVRPALEEGSEEGKSLFVERTLRSGASIKYDGNIIVIGDVNPGAEVIASGNIVVLGSLRGVAHAGATGNNTAMVSAYHLAPTQLRIADLVARSPEGESDWLSPELARIKEGQLVVEALHINALRTRK